MNERANYSRVYWTIVDDPKFAAIFDDDHHLAGWLRMLLIADQAYPASGHLPTNVRRSSVKALADAGLVDLVADHRFRIHGLDAERAMRSQSGRIGAAVRWHSDPESDRNARRDETSKRLDETVPVGDKDRPWNRPRPVRPVEPSEASA